MTVVLNLCIAFLCGVEHPFHRNHLYCQKTQIFPAHSIASALQLGNNTENNFMIMVTTMWGTILKDCGIKKVDNHGPREKAHVKS